ncbi:MAG: hypothetical protein KatS3mg118_1903 [Paracoccaceae bacterium]|nr:MAG: hypothetical protein KatS3mg118_1903 [Paracoccaceae bacterium]
MSKKSKGDDRIDGDAGDGGRTPIYDDSDRRDDGKASGTWQDDVIYGGRAADGPGGEDSDTTTPGDTIGAGSGNDRVYSGAGDDRVDGESGDDTIHGGAGDDSLYGGSQDDTLIGGEGNDSIDAGSEQDIVYAGSGDDSIQGGSGDDLIMAGEGDDVIDSGSERDIVHGGAGDDKIDGDAGDDTIYGGEGEDSIDASHHNDFVYGGAGDDTLWAGSGDDTIYADDGNDIIYGVHNNNTLYGGSGDDTIYGGTSNDTIVGGAGDDTFSGSWGADHFVLSPGGGRDVITDFRLDDGDRLDVSQLTRPDGRPVAWKDVTVADDGEGNAELIFPKGERVVLKGFSPKEVNNQKMLMAIGVPCFTPGTLIMTPRGPVAVERLRPGDPVLTADDGPQPILWVGRQTLEVRAEAQRPVILPAGAVGNRRPLMVSAQHGFLTRITGEEALIRARHLIGRLPGVRWAHGVRRVTYLHLLLPRHQLILAEGALTESFYPGPVGVGGLPADQRAALFGTLPGLARLAPGISAEDCGYGPRARPLLRRRDLPRGRARAGGFAAAIPA